MTRPATFRQSDLDRVLRALKAGGNSIGAVDVRPDGSFRVLTQKEVEQEARAPEEAWDRGLGWRRSA